MLQTQSLYFQLKQRMEMFKQPSFAWELLEYEIMIESKQVPDGMDIANLLQLYMRGVEVMNTMMDPRESYFKNKVTSLMGKNTVMKSFKQQNSKTQTAIDSAQSANINGQSKNVKKQSKKQGFKSTTALLQKKKELELRLAYAAQEHDYQNLRKMILKSKETEMKMANKISKIMKNHDQSLNQRINRRKLRSSTYRSKIQDQGESLQSLQPSSQQKNMHKANLVTAGSLRQISDIIPEAPEVDLQKKRRHKSAQARVGLLKQTQENMQNLLDSRKRKKTVDFSELYKH